MLGAALVLSIWKASGGNGLAISWASEDVVSMVSTGEKRRHSGLTGDMILE